MGESGGVVPRRALLETPPPSPGTTKAELNWPWRKPASWGWGGREGSEERSLWVLGRLSPRPAFFPAASGDPGRTESVPHRDGEA